LLLLNHLSCWLDQWTNEPITSPVHSSVRFLKLWLTIKPQRCGCVGPTGSGLLRVERVTAAQLRAAEADEADSAFERGAAEGTLNAVPFRDRPRRLCSALSRADAAWCRTHSTPPRRLPGHMAVPVGYAAGRWDMLAHLRGVARTSAASCDDKWSTGHWH
jgi:hypothetical protein